MSLLSAKNFITPFTSRLHLLTIVVLTGLFVVIRWSGTEFISREDPKDRSYTSPKAARKAPRPLRSENTVLSEQDELLGDIMAAPRRTTKAPEDIVDDILTKQNKMNPDRQDGSGRSISPLAEIEKMLSSD